MSNVLLAFQAPAYHNASTGLEASRGLDNWLSASQLGWSYRGCGFPLSPPLVTAVSTFFFWYLYCKFGG